jgi:hypothetical protein
MEIATMIYVAIHRTKPYFFLSETPIPDSKLQPSGDWADYSQELQRGEIALLARRTLSMKAGLILPLKHSEANRIMAAVNTHLAPKFLKLSHFYPCKAFPRHICKLTTLEELVLHDGTGRFSNGWWLPPAMKKMGNLRRLDLSANVIFNHGLDMLASLPNLEYLSLRDCQLNQYSGLEKVKVTHLDVSGVKMRDGSRLPLAQMKITHLTVSLDGNDVTLTGDDLKHFIVSL